MEKRSPIPYVAIVAALVVATLALAFTPDVRYTGEAGVREQLPARVGEWTGETIYFCQAQDCGKVVRASEIKDPGQCPYCGGALSGGSALEWSLLPPDTEIHKAVYTRPNSDESLVVAVVVGGRSRTSIHRPQICLVGNGQEITETRPISVTTSDGRKIRVTLLNLLRSGRAPSGVVMRQSTFYTYWFIGKGHETDSHLVRMFWMAYDRIVHGVWNRWAYVGIAGQPLQDAKATDELAASFVRDFEPLIRVP